MSDMTAHLTKQLEELRPPEEKPDRPKLKLRDLLANGIPGPKKQEKKHEYRVIRLEQYF